jgi:splicing factor 3B subunit 2
LTVAELKQLVPFPDAVEAHDVTSADPRFLVFLKSYRNTVPIPRHWCHKRKYLQGKRGVEKQPFALPEFIAQTGIGEVRGIDAEEDAKKKSKQKARDRVAPKMGRVDIDYQVLHDAFFRYQTKPKLTILGDLYVAVDCCIDVIIR